MGACTDSAFASQFGLNGSFAPIASWELLSVAVEIARARGFRYHIGNLFSTDLFYAERGAEVTASWKKMGVLAAEMEAAGLYATAARAGKRALALCTISDHLLTGEETRPEERQTTFTQMIEVALETAYRMENP